MVIFRASPGWCAILAIAMRETKNSGEAGQGVRPLPKESTIAGIVSGEFDRIPDANDAFLELVGYSREDLLAGRLRLARSDSGGIFEPG